MTQHRVPGHLSLSEVVLLAWVRTVFYHAYLRVLSKNRSRIVLAEGEYRTTSKPSSAPYAAILRRLRPIFLP